MRDRLLLLLVGLVLVSCSRGNEMYTPPTTAASAPVELLSSRLQDASDPSQILLIGDDTGASMGGWIYLVGQALSQRYGRPVELHDRDLAGGAGYVKQATQVSPGSGAPIVIWNASAARNIEFLTSTMTQVSVPEPEDVELVLVNNGLNQAADTLARESISLMRDLASDYAEAAVVAVLQPTPPSPRDLRETSLSNARDLEISCRINDFQSIDVSTAEVTYDAGSRYPNADGIRTWAKVVAESLESSITVRRS